MSSKKITATVIYALIYPLLLFLSLEILNVSINGENYSYILRNIPAVVVSYALVLSVTIIFFMISGNLFTSGLLVSFPLLLFYIVNYYRRLLTGSVLIPSDLNLVKQVNIIVSFSSPPFKVRVLIAALCVFVIQIPLFRGRRVLSLRKKSRVTGVIVTGALIIFLFFSPFSRENIMPVFNIDTSTREGINILYETDGALMGFYTLCFAKPNEAPSDYGRKYMTNLVAELSAGNEAVETSAGVLPDIIIVMSEAFTDPQRLPNVKYSEDPVPNLHMLTGKTTSGYTVTPAFGGLTCNPEYELLTGNSMRFVGYGDTPYHKGEEYIDRDNGRSLASMFKKNGYSTIALHTNTATFYDRNIHYPKLGFDEFIAAEQLPDAKYKGSLPDQELISDEYFTDKLFEIMEDAEEPLFLFGITMQNHSAYLPEKYESTRIKAASGLLEEKDIHCLETYVEGVNDADTQLGRLYDYVMESDRPTIVAYFGDHLPVITENTGVFTNLGYIENMDLSVLTLDETYLMYTTPYVAFSNYKNLPETWGDISPYFLGALIAEASGVKLNLYYTFLLRAYESFHAMSGKLYVDEDDAVYSQPLVNDAEITKMFQAIQYDKLFGQDYAGSAMSALDW